MMFGWLLFIVLIGVFFYMYDKNSRGSYGGGGHHGGCCGSHGNQSSCCQKDKSNLHTDDDHGNKHNHGHSHD